MKPVKGMGSFVWRCISFPDVYVPCEVCKGKRYSRETLEIRFKGKNISDVLEMTVEEALSFFENIPRIKRKLGNIERRRSGLHKAQVNQQRLFPEGKPRESSSQPTLQRDPRAGQSTCWTSQRRACTLRTSKNCSTCWVGCQVRATR